MTHIRTNSGEHSVERGIIKGCHEQDFQCAVHQPASSEWKWSDYKYVGLRHCYMAAADMIELYDRIPMPCWCDIEKFMNANDDEDVKKGSFLKNYNSSWVCMYKAAFQISKMERKKDVVMCVVWKKEIPSWLIIQQKFIGSQPEAVKHGLQNNLMLLRRFYFTTFARKDVFVMNIKMASLIPPHFKAHYHRMGNVFMPPCWGAWKPVAASFSSY